VFDVLEKLGEGSYGAVLKARHKASGKIYAVKSVVFLLQFSSFFSNDIDGDNHLLCRLVPIVENEGLNEIMREVQVMEGVDSDYIVRTYGKFVSSEHLWVSSHFSLSLFLSCLSILDSDGCLLLLVIKDCSGVLLWSLGG